MNFMKRFKFTYCGEYVISTVVISHIYSLKSVNQNHWMRTRRLILL